MAHRRKKLRLLGRHTAQALRKWSKTRLIRLILRLESARISRIGRRRTTRKSKGSRRRGSKRRLRAGVHFVKVGRTTRKVRVNAKGQWKFLKGKTRSRTRRRRR